MGIPQGGPVVITVFPPGPPQQPPGGLPRPPDFFRSFIIIHGCSTHLFVVPRHLQIVNAAGSGVVRARS